MRQADLDLRCRIVPEDGFAWSRPVDLLLFMICAINVYVDYP